MVEIKLRICDLCGNEQRIDGTNRDVCQQFSTTTLIWPRWAFDAGGDDSWKKMLCPRCREIFSLALDRALTECEDRADD